MIAHRYVLLLILVSGGMQAMNLLRPYNTLIRPDYNNKHRVQCSVIGETSFSDRAFGSHGRTNALSIWNPNQDTLAMLDGFSNTSAIGQKRLAVDASDDGVRGHVCFNGTLKNRFSGLFGTRVFFKEQWSLSLYLPLYAMELTDVCWIDKTLLVTDEDVRVRELLTNDLAANVCQLSNGLEIGGWKRTGVGDLVLLLDWFRDFHQEKPLLRNVRINWRVGLGMPTGLREDVDKLMAFAYGYDGSFFIPFGLGLDFHFVFGIRAGFDVQLTQALGNTRMRRFKTNQNQTDLLLLQKQSVYKDFGLTQQFNLYAQLYKPFGGFSLLLGYQFFKQGASQLALCTGSSFSEAVANSAEYLLEWTIHQFVVRADYDVSEHLVDPFVAPRFEAYVELPFNGKRSVATSNVGIGVAIDF